MRREYRCPNCQIVCTSAKALTRHLLEEAAPRGVTTNEFLVAGCGSRFGARIHELRHAAGLRIDEERMRDGQSRYRLIQPAEPAPAESAVAPPPTGGGGSQLFDTADMEFDAAIPDSAEVA